MKWSKLRSLIENQFAPSIAKRISINSAAYGNCSCGRAWLTLDKDEIANFCTRAYANVNMFYGAPHYKSNKKFDKTLVEYGELSRQGAYKSCWDYIHKYKINESLYSREPMLQTLAILDKRIGKNKLKNLDVKILHPLALKLYKVRLEAEGLRNPKLP